MGATPLVTPMTSLSQAALDAASDRGEYLLASQLVTYVERYDRAVDGGVPRYRLREYVGRLHDENPTLFDADDFETLLDEALTDADAWAGQDALYEVEGGISAFPPRWHDRLAGEDDLTAYVDVIQADLSASDEFTGAGAAGEGVPRELLFDAAAVLGPFDRDSAAAELERLQEHGDLVEQADQHPQARVSLDRN